MLCRKYTIKNTIVRVGSHMRMRVMDAAKCLEFLSEGKYIFSSNRIGVFFGQNDRFLRTKFWLDLNVMEWTYREK